MSDALRIATQETNAVVPDGLEMAANWAAGRNGRSRTERTITGEACACPDTSAPTRPSVILDPFGGTGTTALVADVLGRHGISADMSADYGRVARWRVADPKQRERAARPAKSRNDAPRAGTPRTPKARTGRNAGPGYVEPTLFDIPGEGT